MKHVHRLLLSLALLGLLAMPALAQWSIIPVSQVRSGSILYADGTSRDLTMSDVLGLNSGASIDLVPDYGHALITGHLKVTFFFRIRYTAQSPSEVLPSVFHGMESHAMAVSAESANLTTPSVAAVRPDGDAAFSVSVYGEDFGAQYGMPGVYVIGQTNSDWKDKYIAHDVHLAAEQTDTDGNRYREGTTQFTSVLDINTAYGTAEAHDQMWIGAAKSILISRPENTGIPIDDDGAVLPDFLEKDAYDDSGSNGTGDSRFSNDEHYLSYVGYNTSTVVAVGTNFGQEAWNPALLGFPWPSADALTQPSNLEFSPLCLREWHWYCGETGDWGAGYNTQYPFPIAVGSFNSARQHVDWPWDISTNYIPRDKLEEAQGSSNNPLPPPVSNHIFLHLIDTDLTGVNGDAWNFDQTANFHVTFHNKYENAQEVGAPASPPLTDNPWRIFLFQNTPIETSGGTNGNVLSASIQYYVEHNIGGEFGLTYGIVAVGVNAGVNNGAALSHNVGPVTVPPGMHGVVYYHLDLRRHTFTYTEYLKGGRYIPGYNVDGTEQVLTDHVDRPAAGLGTDPSVEFAVFLLADGPEYPKTIALDPPAQN